MEKYGLMEDFVGIVWLRWDYYLSEDNGDFFCDYLEVVIGCYNCVIWEWVVKELVGLEVRLFFEKVVSWEWKVVYLWVDNWVSFMVLFKWEWKELFGKW